jgi:catechol 2,3-dioxygenase-like lactoylglutathione lyase family enzyme
MSRYVDPGEQLVVELYVRNLIASCAFYQEFGFQLVRDEEDFAELKWEDTLFFLEASPDGPPPPTYPVGNIRIMVPDVDKYWIVSQKMGVQIIRPIENCSYGLRDFTIAGPDGVGLRFATRLSDIERIAEASANKINQGFVLGNKVRMAEVFAKNGFLVLSSVTGEEQAAEVNAHQIYQGNRGDDSCTIEHPILGSLT